MPKTSYTNADLIERKPLTVTVQRERMPGPRPYTPSRDVQLLDEALARGDTGDSLLTGATGALQRSASLSNDLLAAGAKSPLAAEVEAQEQASYIPPIMETIGTLTGTGLAFDAVENRSPAKMALAALAMYPIFKSAKIASTAFKGLRGGGKVAKVSTMPIGQQKAVAANKGYDILKEERLGNRKPSPSYAQQLRRHAAEAEGIPSANLRGPRSQTRISHLSQLPEEREITAEQLWKYMEPEQLDKLSGIQVGESIGTGMENPSEFIKLMQMFGLR